MNWYLQSGKDSDVAISTRIRLARNLNGFKFNLNSKNEIDRLENKIKDNVFAIGYGLKFFKLKDMDDITKMSLVEKNLISPEFALEKNEIGSILINDEENIDGGPYRDLCGMHGAGGRMCAAGGKERKCFIGHDRRGTDICMERSESGAPRTGKQRRR